MNDDCVHEDIHFALQPQYDLSLSATMVLISLPIRISWKRKIIEKDDIHSIAIKKSLYWLLQHITV